MNHLRNLSILFLSATALSFFLACGEGTSEARANMKEGYQDAMTEGESSSQDDAYTIKVLNDSIPSPRKEMTGSIGETDITVNYGSPAMKGRTLWGDLVAYEEVWRTGANEATAITFSEDVIIEGQELSAGTYGLFTIPGETDWTLIFNETAEQWGAYEYDEAQDVLRVKVTPKMVEESAENLDFMIVGDQLVMQWGQAQVPVTVQ